MGKRWGKDGEKMGKVLMGGGVEGGPGSPCIITHSSQ
jgi:hypothetical protein